MNEVFVVANQLGQYWGKKKKWVDGTDPKKVLVNKHEDEAVNLLVELSARDIDLRGEVKPTACNERGVPRVEPSEHLIADEPKVLEEEASANEEPSAYEEPSASEEPSANEEPSQSDTTA